MPIPESARVIYGKNPLEEVICQLKYPTILRIDKEIPADFQEAIRGEYPIFAEPQEAGISASLPQEVAKIFGPELALGTQHRLYRFSTEDEQWSVTLTKDFIALSTRSYRQWEEFKQRLEQAVRVFVDQYQPHAYSRIGLRYRDVIHRSKLGLKDVPWAELLSPYIAGALAATYLAPSISHVARQLRMALNPESNQVLLRHGSAIDKQTNEPAYVIDADFFTEQKTEINDALRVLDYFNREAGRLFRWCIEDRLHDAMEPASVG